MDLFRKLLLNHSCPCYQRYPVAFEGHEKYNSLCKFSNRFCHVFKVCFN